MFDRALLRADIGAGRGIHVCAVIGDFAQAIVLSETVSAVEIVLPWIIVAAETGAVAAVGTRTGTDHAGVARIMFPFCHDIDDTSRAVGFVLRGGAGDHPRLV